MTPGHPGSRLCGPGLRVASGSLVITSCPLWHRHLGEEPDPFRPCLHHQVPGPLQQLHFRLQHSNEGEASGRVRVGGGPPSHHEGGHLCHFGVSCWRSTGLEDERHSSVEPLPTTGQLLQRFSKGTVAKQFMCGMLTSQSCTCRELSF